MNKKEAITKFEAEIENFLAKEDCKLSNREKFKFTSYFPMYLQVLADLNDVETVDEIITGPSVEYSDLKAKAFEASPSSPGAFKHGGDRSPYYRFKGNDIDTGSIKHSLDLTARAKKRIINEAKTGNKWKFVSPRKGFSPEVYTENLEQNPEWEKIDSSFHPDSIEIETSFKKTFLKDLKEDFEKSFEILEKNIFPDTPDFEPTSNTIQAKWWREVQAFRHVVAIQFCKSAFEEENSDGRVTYSKAMKIEARKFYEAHEEEAKNMDAKTWVEAKLFPHLAQKFNKETDFFKESHFRKGVLKLTS